MYMEILGSYNYLKENAAQLGGVFAVRYKIRFEGATVWLDAIRSRTSLVCRWCDNTQTTLENEVKQAFLNAHQLYLSKNYEPRKINIVSTEMYRDGGTLGFIVHTNGPNNEICVGKRRNKIPASALVWTDNTSRMDLDDVITWGYPTPKNGFEPPLELNKHELAVFENALISYTEYELKRVDDVFKVLQKKKSST